MDPGLRDAARRAFGFMPDDEGMALYEAALQAAPRGPLLEIGSYCGKSTLYLAGAAREHDSIVFSVDHHRGSEEHQPGEEYHDPALTDAEGNVDTLATFRRTIERAGLSETVVAIVASSEVAAKAWATPLALVFIDGGHSSEAASTDYRSWTPHLMPAGLLAIHDVFEDPSEGGQAPFEIYQRALESRAFEELSRRGSLRVLRRAGS